MKFTNYYVSLGDKFFQRVLPQKVPLPKLLLWNSELANSLLISEKLQNNHEQLSQYFSGNKLFDGAEPIALAYSGHQFGHFNPQLGDGRAHLLGEVFDKQSTRCDIQLKGSGQTPFSRRGDGKCALAPALREYIMSEALFALGVPTSRCLAVVSTGETINRGLAKPGAVVTRVAASHIRVGTFQYFAARGDTDSLKSLLNHCIDRHFPEMNSSQMSEEQRILAFLEQAIDKQITLIIQWLRVGFIHGVMNTDNTAISGETLDYGPCAMMGSYDEKAVFSSIDEYARYAFGNQGKIAQWNMARLADCLLPLLLDCGAESSDGTSSEKEQEQLALQKVEALIHQYSGKFDEAYYAMYAKKLGLGEVNADSKLLVDDLLAIMQRHGLDYTKTFYLLTQSLSNAEQGKRLQTELDDWYDTWLSALKNTNLNSQQNYLKHGQKIMGENNPIVIPRNHHVEAILARCEDVVTDNSSPQMLKEAVNNIVGEFLSVLRSPYHEVNATKNYQDTPKDDDKYYQTFCGT